MDNQNQDVQYQQQYAAHQPQFTPAPQAEEVSFKEWLVSLLLLLIPFVGIIMVFVWAFGDGKQSKKNFFRAYLVFIGILIALYILLLILFGAALFSLAGSV